VAAVGQAEGRPAERTLFGHPVGLANLFGVELWERFSFYGMLTILGYYLYYSVTEGGLELPKTTATGIVGAYGGLVYLSTVLGGWIADRLLGMELRSASAPRCRECWPTTTIRRTNSRTSGSSEPLRCFAGVVVFAIAPWMSRLMEGVH
jgi:hypothetical protein